MEKIIRKINGSKATKSDGLTFSFDISKTS